jgi:hypothetical protein
VLPRLNSAHRELSVSVVPLARAFVYLAVRASVQADQWAAGYQKFPVHFRADSCCLAVGHQSFEKSALPWGIELGALCSSMENADPIPPVSWRVPGVANLQDKPVLGYTVAQSMEPHGFDEDQPFIDDSILSSVKNACLALLDGSDFERLAVLSHVSEFLTHCPDETLEEMVPEIACYAVTWRNKFKLAAAEALYTVATAAVPPASSRIVVVAAFRIIDDASEGPLIVAWGEILVSFIPHLTPEDVDAVVMPALSIASSSASQESRRLAGRLLHCLGRICSEEEIEQVLLGQALRLCDDRDSNVRAAAAHALSSLGVRLPVTVAEETLWPKLCGLVEDTAARVHANAIRAIARIGEVHKQHCISCRHYQSQLLPIFLKECSAAISTAQSDLRSVDDDTYFVLETFAEVYGHFLCAVHVVLSGQDSWNKALNALRRMVVCNGPTVRHWCAYHLPAVALVCHRTRPEKLAQVVLALANDSDTDTRVTLAAGLHETIRLLSSGYMRNEVYSAARTLINDESKDVRREMFLHLEAILTLAAHNEPFLLVQSDTARGSDDAASLQVHGLARSECLPGETQLSMLINDLSSVCRDHWRTQDVMARQIELSAHVIPFNILCDRVAPLMFYLARESTSLVRKSAMSALVRIIRYIPCIERRDHVVDHLCAEWARGNLYWTRLAFVDAAEAALQIFSCKLFRQLFSEELFQLAHDRVDNVRLRLAHLLPSIATKCGSFGAFERALEALKMDPDPDIMWSISLARNALCDSVAEGEANVRQENEESIFFMSISGISLIKENISTAVIEDIAKTNAAVPGPISLSSSASEPSTAISMETSTSDSDSARLRTSAKLTTNVLQAPAQEIEPNSLVQSSKPAAAGEVEVQNSSMEPKTSHGRNKGRRLLSAGRLFSAGTHPRARTSTIPGETSSTVLSCTHAPAQDALATTSQQGLDRKKERGRVLATNRPGGVPRP